LTHTPPFSREMLSEEAKLILNIWVTPFSTEKMYWLTYHIGVH
jgi:hypothetical protein